MSWPMRPVSELCVLAVDCVNKTAPRVEHETPYKMIRTTNVKGGYISLDDVGYVSEETFEKWTRRSKPIYGDVILTREAPVGEVGRFTATDDHVFLGQRLFHYRANPKLLDWNFLAYALQSHEVQGRLRAMGFGATVEHIKVGDAENLRIPCPPLATQKRIGSALAAYDDLIENNRRRMTLLEESARLLYNEWFVRLRFPGHEHTPIVDGVPQGWQRKALESVCASGDGIQTGPFGSQLHQADYSDEGVPVVMPKDIIGFRISVASIARIPESLADALGRHRMQPGDTVYGRRGDIGRRAYIGKRQAGWFCGTGCLRIRPDPDAILPRYLFDTLGTPETVGAITNRAKGSTMLNLSAAALKPVSVLVPTRRMQDLYVEQVERVHEMVEVLDEQNQKLRAARDLLLPRLMSGELIA